MTDIQYGIKIMGGREVSRPYRFFSPKASGFYPFGDATALAGEGGVGDVVWLIQASASNHKPKGRFFWFVYAKGIPKEPSLWFVQGQLVYHFPKKIGTAWWWGNPDFRVFKEMYVKSYILCARKINRFLRQLRSHPFRG